MANERPVSEEWDGYKLEGAWSACGSWPDLLSGSACGEFSHVSLGVLLVLRLAGQQVHTLSARACSEDSLGVSAPLPLSYVGSPLLSMLETPGMFQATRRAFCLWGKKDLSLR